MFDVLGAMDRSHARISCAQRELLSLIAEADGRESWEDLGARDLAHFLSMRYDISAWKALRWIAAAHALEGLPLLSRAFARGDLGLDKVVELTRFATAETEARLIDWAQEVTCATVRHRGDAAKVALEEAVEAEKARSVSWWYVDDGSRFGLSAELPAAQGAIVARALERMARDVPPMPGEEDAWYLPKRRADALVAMCSARIAGDRDPDRATVVIHAQLGALTGPGGSVGRGVADGCEVENGPAVHPETVRRLLCNARTQTVVEDGGGNVLGLGRLRREPSAWMVRQVRYRDRGCRFAGCGTRAFTEAHHVKFWRHGGRTDFDNLVLICSFHHRLVHEHGWSVRRQADATAQWFRPDGTRYRSGPSPGTELPLLADTA
jgi:hypothetical protein